MFGIAWLRLVGWLANAAGMPCVVREGHFDSAAMGVSVRVRASSLYTIVSVNGVDVYFYRLSGAFDGVGLGCGALPAPPSQE